jgi:hypothetical protein
VRNLSFDVSTAIDGDCIVTEIAEQFDDVRTVLNRRVINTVEQQVRAALIGLGWTPPPENRPLEEVMHVPV